MHDVEFLVPQWGTTPDLAAMPALRVVQVMSAGTDWIDPLVPAGVTLCNARGSRDIPVAEWVVGAILAAFTGLLWAARHTRWEYRPPRELSGARVLIVGHGSIGQATAERLEALGARVTGIGRARLGELRRLAGEADVVVNLVPLSDASRGMFDAAVFGAMPDGALFVNAGRGATVDQAALLDGPADRRRARRGGTGTVAGGAPFVVRARGWPSPATRPGTARRPTRAASRSPSISSRRTRRGGR